MEEEVDELIDSVLASIPDNDQIITNNDDNQLPEVNKYEAISTFNNGDEDYEDLEFED